MTLLAPFPVSPLSSHKKLTCLGRASQLIPKREHFPWCQEEDRSRLERVAGIVHLQCVHQVK